MELALLILSLLLATSYAYPVLDNRGNELKRGKRYYIMPAISGSTGGGLKLVSLKETCPLQVAQEDSKEARGLPVMFFPENPDRSAVQEGGTFYAMFAEPTQCPESTVWRLQDNALTTGGVKSFSALLNYRFALFKDGGAKFAYRIMVCPCGADVDRPTCHLACWTVQSVPYSVVLVSADVEEPVIRSEAQ